MKRTIAPLVLAAALLASCGTPGTVTTEVVAPERTPQNWTTDVPDAFDAEAPVRQGDVVPLQVPTVDVAPEVSPAVVERKVDVAERKVRKVRADRKVEAPVYRKVAAERKVVEPPVFRKVDVEVPQAAPVAPVESPAPVVERVTRQLADPPVVVAPPVVAAPVVPDHQDAPVIDRGTRDLADPPVVVGDTTPVEVVEPAADAVAVDDGVTLLEKER